MRDYSSDVYRVVKLMNESEYFKDIKDKEIFADKLQRVYCIDIGNEIKKMDLWLWANSNKRYRNYKRFIVNWVANKERPYGKY